MAGKPESAGLSETPSTVSRRPPTRTVRPPARTKRSTRRRKSAMWKKEPRKVSVKGIVGKPAGPTEAPGGRAAAAVAEGSAGGGVGEGEAAEGGAVGEEGRLGSDE